MIESTPPESRNRWARFALPLALAASAALAAPSLNAPLFQDDLIHRGILRHAVPGMEWSSLELYDFIGGPSRPAVRLRDGGFVPWFTAGDLKLRFFRPLSSATLALDLHLFGERTWPSRLHSLCWFFGILVLVSALYRRVLSPTSAGVATLVYALSAGHSVPIAWMAARHTLVTTAFALLTVWLYARRRDDGWRAGAWLAPIAFAAGLAAGEMALGALAVIGAWELLGRGDPLRRRIVAIAPFLAIALMYLAGYSALDYGTRNSGEYIGIDGGLASVLAILRHFFILTGEMVVGVPSDAVGTASVNAQIVAAALGAASALAAWAVFRFSRAHAAARDSRALGWLAVASAAAALPGTLALMGGRVLTVALVPASGVMAVVLMAGLAATRDRARPRLTRLLAAAPLAACALGHFVLGPALRLAIGLVFAQIARTELGLASGVPACRGVMVIPAAADPSISTYLPAILTLQGRGPEIVRVLSMAPEDHRIENVTRTGFDLVTLGPHRVRSAWERLYRRAALPAGTRVTIPSFEARVIEDVGGAPVRVRFDFGEPLDSPHLCFLQWHDRAVSGLAPPKPGDTIDLPLEPGPMIK